MIINTNVKKEIAFDLANIVRCDTVVTMIAGAALAQE